MILSDGYADVPAGKIAAVVTSLEMTQRPALRPDPPEEAGFALRRVPQADLDWFRALFRHVGENYLWFSRLRMSDQKLADELHDPAMELYSLTRDGEDLGLLMLDFRLSGEVELAFFGVADELIGTGGGRWLMNRAIERAWERPIKRFWVHTCTHDHPAALSFYIRSGFRPYRRQIEIADDPRLLGHLPRTAAPQIPII
ncbi:MAG TPA: GNAT family N-acetyltransferase [Aliidongia sp.]|uniref:GNAT family N-acetyltransferase n=1 Tax=Aliidongia sp. TaxID=1914230 RepID=UPI002DDCF17C|nr:GNAT family N-acetyltransferase [Aliidongia sp.]HEV2674002.1 GNAT family N-acetyltransferase [Aliidongia sp.]